MAAKMALWVERCSTISHLTRELTGTNRKATARQIETLVKAKVLAEDDEELDQLTKAEASKLISELFAK